MGCGGSKASEPSQQTKKSVPNLLTSTVDKKPYQSKSDAGISQLLRDTFKALDKNGDGHVSKEELSSTLSQLLDCSELQSQKTVRSLIQEAGMNPYIDMFDQLDTNQDGRISWQEFENNLHPTMAANHIEQMLKSVFDRLDANKDGVVSQDELSANMCQILDCSDLVSQKNVRDLLKDAGLNPECHLFEKLDMNKDGKVTWDEFKANLRPAVDVTDLLKKVFFNLDANGDGTVSKDELSATFSRMLDCSLMKTKKSFRTLISDAGLNPDFYVFEQLDINQDGKITWEEFESQLTGMPVRETTSL
jgi:Ca2+-binding EF-hand superfamily protein